MANVPTQSACFGANTTTVPTVAAPSNLPSVLMVAEMSMQLKVSVVVSNLPVHIACEPVSKAAEGAAYWHSMANIPTQSALAGVKTTRVPTAVVPVNL